MHSFHNYEMTFVNGLTIHVNINYSNNIMCRNHKFFMDWENKELIQNLYFQIDEKLKCIVLIVESEYKDGCIKTLHINFMINGDTIILVMGHEVNFNFTKKMLITSYWNFDFGKCLSLVTKHIKPNFIQANNTQL